MRAIPVDTTKVNFIGTGKAAARSEYAELSDGTRRRTGQQAKDTDSGMPLWTVDVLIDDDDADRAEVASVKVASWDEPTTDKWKPVRFRGLVAVPYVDSGTNRVKLSFRAEGIENAATKPLASAS